MPGQYVHIARHLAQSGHEVSFITQPPPSGDGHAYMRELERGVANGLAVARLCEWLARDGSVPNIVIGHNGGKKFSTLRIFGRKPRYSAISNSSIG